MFAAEAVHSQVIFNRGGDLINVDFGQQVSDTAMLLLAGEWRLGGVSFTAITCALHLQSCDETCLLRTMPPVFPHIIACQADASRNVFVMSHRCMQELCQNRSRSRLKDLICMQELPDANQGDINLE